MTKRHQLPLLLLAALFIFAGCASSRYAKEENWLIRQSEPATPQTFDLFYVYPTLVANKEKPLMDCQDAKTRTKALGFARAQTEEIFLGDARVFAPCIRQLEYLRCLKLLDNPSQWGETELATGIQDTCDAFQYYMKHWNQGRPVILLGHSQGSMDLYEMLRRMQKISPKKGLVAAYLPGLPRVSTEDMKRDFAGRDIQPAKGADDLGVIIVWNTQSPTAVSSPFAKAGTYCINPLHWRCDASPAPASLNRLSHFYRYWEKSPEKQRSDFRAFCGAQIDPAKGALIVQLPENSEYDARGAMGLGIFHAADIWLFAGNIRDNAAQRVQKWLRENKKGLPAKN